MAKYYKQKSDEEKRQEIENLIKQGEDGVENYTKSEEDIKKYLDFQARFYDYSIRNTILIDTQFPGAQAVAGYKQFEEMGYHVNRGEKAISIIGYSETTYFHNEKTWKKLSLATDEEKVKIASGEYETRKQGHFQKLSVFDVSQTDIKSEDIPKLFPGRWLDGQVPDYDELFEAAKKTAAEIGATIIESTTELGMIKGLTHTDTKEIELNQRNTQLQNIKTLIHEMAHAKLHYVGSGNEDIGKAAKELQAELTAYVTCRHFNLDTGADYSFGYIADWTKNTDLKDKEKLLKGVADTAKQFIDGMEKHLREDIDMTRVFQKEENLRHKKEELEAVIYDNEIDLDKVPNRQIGETLRRGISLRI